MLAAAKFSLGNSSCQSLEVTSLSSHKSSNSSNHPNRTFGLNSDDLNTADYVSTESILKQRQVTSNKQHSSIGAVLEFYAENIFKIENESSHRHEFIFLARKFLEVVPPEERFSETLVRNALHNCISRYCDGKLDSWSPIQAAESFLLLERITLNLLCSPWKAEYKNIQTWTGTYRHKLLPGLYEELENLILSIGYVKSSGRRGQNLTFELYSVPAFETLAELSCNLYLASQECRLMAELVELSESQYLGFSSKQCCFASLRTSGSPSIRLEWLRQNLKPDNEHFGSASVPSNLLEKSPLEERFNYANNNAVSGAHGMIDSVILRDPSMSRYILLTPEQERAMLSNSSSQCTDSVELKKNASGGYHELYDGLDGSVILEMAHETQARVGMTAASQHASHNLYDVNNSVPSKLSEMSPLLKEDRFNYANKHGVSETRGFETVILRNSNTLLTHEQEHALPSSSSSQGSDSATSLSIKTPTNLLDDSAEIKKNASGGYDKFYDCLADSETLEMAHETQPRVGMTAASLHASHNLNDVNNSFSTNRKTVSCNISMINDSRGIELKDDLIDSPPLPNKGTSFSASSFPFSSITGACHSPLLTPQRSTHQASNFAASNVTLRDKSLTDHWSSAPRSFDSSVEYRNKLSSPLTASAHTPRSSLLDSKSPAMSQSSQHPRHSKEMKSSVEEKTASTWLCGSCTFRNTTNDLICFMCSQSRTRLPEKPLPIGGSQCDICTLINELGAKECSSCTANLKNAPTYL